MLHQTYKEQQESEMLAGLRNWYATRNDPKPPAPVNNELADFNRAMERHTARENAQRMDELNEHFRRINSQRATKSN